MHFVEATGVAQHAGGVVDALLMQCRTDAESDAVLDLPFDGGGGVASPCPRRRFCARR